MLIGRSLGRSLSRMTSRRSRHAGKAGGQLPARSAIAIAGITAALAGLGLPATAGAAILADATVSTDVVTDTVVLGNTSNGVGTMTVDSGATLKVDDQGSPVVLGEIGGINYQRGSAYLGFNLGYEGAALVTGTGTQWQIDQTLYVGFGGLGVLNIQNDASVTANNVSIGNNSSSTGNLAVSGQGASLLVQNNLLVGPSGHGTLTIADKGSVRVLNETSMYSSNDTILLDGGTLHTRSLNRSQGTFNHRDGTLIVDEGTYTHYAGLDLQVTGFNTDDHSVFKLVNGATTSDIKDLWVGGFSNLKGSAYSWSQAVR